MWWAKAWTPACRAYNGPRFHKKTSGCPVATASNNIKLNRIVGTLRLKVTAAIILKGNRLLITQRSYPKNLAGLWEFPGGKVEDGESLGTCLVRELAEELELTVAVLSPFLVVEHSYDDCDIELHSFTAKYVSGKLVSHSHRNVEWVSVKQLSGYQFVPADKSIVDKLTGAFKT